MEISFKNEKENTFKCDRQFYTDSLLLVSINCMSKIKNLPSASGLMAHVDEKCAGECSSDCSPVSAEEAFAFATALEQATAQVPDEAVYIDEEMLFEDRTDLPNGIFLVGEEDSLGNREKLILPVKTSYLAQGQRCLLISLSGKKLELNHLISFLKQGAYKLA